jgi:hypothetical protein
MRELNTSSDSGAKVAIVDSEKPERIREHIPKLSSSSTLVARGWRKRPIRASSHWTS